LRRRCWSVERPQNFRRVAKRFDDYVEDFLGFRRHVRIKILPRRY
jgi:hypothetical protein